MAPESSSQLLDSDLLLDDEDEQDPMDLAMTLDRKTRIATARLPAIAPLAIDIAPAAPSAKNPFASWATFLYEPRYAFGAALAVGCLVAGTSGVVLGRSSAGAVEAREPRTTVVLEANEEVTILPLAAPEKAIEQDEPVPTPLASAPRPTPGAARHPWSFGHLGSDRGAARRSTTRQH